MTPVPVRRFGKRFPALSRTLLLSLGLTFFVFSAAKIYFHAPKEGIFLLGDSGIGNYRLGPGDRLQDFVARKHPGTPVVNWAEPGSSMADCYLQLERGILLSGKPALAVIAISPDKFLDDEMSHRFTDDGANLRWIPWNSQGLEFFSGLDHKQQGNAVVQFLSLPFYAVVDAGLATWVHFVQWPSERDRMLQASRDRRLQIERASSGTGITFGNKPIGDETKFSEAIQAKDADFLLRSLRSHRIETVVLVMPFSNPELLRRTWSASALAKRDRVVGLMKSWLERRNVAYVDFNSPEELAHFPDSAWDDQVHLKDPKAFAYITDRIDPVLGSRLANSTHGVALSERDPLSKHRARAETR
jgi:hypothetical protein